MNATNPTTLRIVLVADPDLPTEIARNLAHDLPDLLQQQTPETDWQVLTVTAPLIADEQVDVSGMIGSVRPHLHGLDWDIGVFLTDLPRRAGLTPVSAEVSPVDHVALISLPALGSLRLRRRAAQAVLSVVGSLISGGTHTDGPARRRSQVIGRRAPGAPLDPTADGPVPERYIVPSPRGMLYLIAGMVRANRPWRLFTALSRALAGVFATAAYGMINNTAWQIAASLDTRRQLLVTVLSVLALTAWIIVDHELWERPDGDLPRALSRLYNLVTSLTIGLGVLFLYSVLFVVLNAVAALLLSPSVLGQVLTHRPTVTDYLALSWFVTSLAMIGGAFGSGLEDDGTVRNAAYGRRQRSRREQQKSSEADPGAGRADS